MLRQNTKDHRLTIIAVCFILLSIAVIAKLFVLQILQHEYYLTFALSTQDIYKQLHPKRGQIYFRDARNDKTYPAAVNRQYFLVYAVPKDIKPENASSTLDKLSQYLTLTDLERKNLLEKFSDKTNQYLVITKKIEKETKEKIQNEKIEGIYFKAQEYRYYPEENLAEPVLGFTRLGDDGIEQIGSYGVEGYWDKTLAGKKGFIAGARGASGNMITLADHTKMDAQDGADLILTIDRTLQYTACENLRKGMVEYKAKSASLVLMNPKTGEIYAMCSLPDYDPNKYSEVKDIDIFNNDSAFYPYEPGSVFKPINMASAIDLNLVSPNTTFTDPCKIKIGLFTIHNAQNKCYGTKTMTQVLENSINTGMVFVWEKLGNKNMLNYLRKFGFGEKTGVEISPETGGNISSLEKNGDIYGANASFGQGVMTTPIQLALAYSAIANDGYLPTPHIVNEIDYSNGKKDKLLPQNSKQIISSRTAKLTSGMLVSVVENHYKAARIPGYLVAGKTGTAQIAEKGGWSADRTNHTFAGFAPANDPQFVLIVKYEEPQRQWAEQTTLPIFRDTLKFALEYFDIKKNNQ